jgi:hypothetical protein
MKARGLIIIFYMGIISTPLFPDVINKVMISGYGGQHDLDVREAFLAGYRSYNSTEYSGEAILYSQNILSSFIYAQQNGYEMIIRSTTGLTTGISFADDYPMVELVMPAGSNSFSYVYSGDIDSCSVIVTGAGIDSNVTGYSLEFFSIDPITGYNYSSYSNGFIAGELAFISNTLNIGLDSTRALARIHSSGGGTLDPFSGFGKINIEEILNSVLPVELSLFQAFLIGNSVHLNWRTETEVNNYGFEIQRRDISSISPNFDYEKIGFIKGYDNSNSPKQYSFIDNEIQSPRNYSYRLKQIDNDGKYEYSKEIQIDAITPEGFTLQQNYPNPFNPTTKIRYSIPTFPQSSPSQGGEAEQEWFTVLKVFDVLGNEVATLINEEQKPGTYEVEFNAGQANSLSSGVYYYQLRTGIFVETKKMIFKK